MTINKAFTKTGLGGAHPANGPLSVERLVRVRDELQRTLEYSEGSNLNYMVADAAKAIDEVLAVRKVVQEPVAWRYRFVHTPKSEEHGSYFTTDWVLTHSEDECNPSDCFEPQPLYAAPQLPQSAPDHLAAVATLESKGYSWHGGQFWKPPIGKSPAYITGEQPAVPDENGLLPCPFCGGKCDAKGWAGIAPGGGLAHGPECEYCGSTADTVENWNRRAAMLQGKE